MTFEALIAFNIALIAAWIAPGPAMLVAMNETLRGGLLGGLATGVGLGLIASLWTLAALLGLDTLFTLVPWAYGVLRITGAVYLLWIAVQTWRHARAPLAPVAQAPGHAIRRSLQRGMLVNLGNPKSILFAAAVLVVIFPPNLSFAQALVVSLNHFMLEVALYGVLALILSRPTFARSYLSAKVIFDRISAGILGALGLRLLYER